LIFGAAKLITEFGMWTVELGVNIAGDGAARLGLAVDCGRIWFEICAA